MSELVGCWDNVLTQVTVDSDFVAAVFAPVKTVALADSERVEFSGGGDKSQLEKNFLWPGWGLSASCYPDPLSSLATH